MQESSRILELELHIRKPPKSVRGWWTDFPDDYSATDKTEQPFRIQTTRKFPEGRELLTFWRTPDGKVVENREIMRVNKDGSWTFDIPNHVLGLRIRDEFIPEEKEYGTLLRIKSTIQPLEPDASARIPALMERMTNVWKRAGEICERDAP